eukprot:g2836.t1
MPESGVLQYPTLRFSDNDTEKRFCECLWDARRYSRAFIWLFAFGYGVFGAASFEEPEQFTPLIVCSPIAFAVEWLPRAAGIQRVRLTERRVIYSCCVLLVLGVFLRIEAALRLSKSQEACESGPLYELAFCRTVRAGHTPGWVLFAPFLMAGLLPLIGLRWQLSMPCVTFTFLGSLAAIVRVLRYAPKSIITSGAMGQLYTLQWALSAGACCFCSFLFERALRLEYAAQRDLRRAHQRAEALRKNFLAVFTHELRTPLNSVLGNLRLLDASLPSLLMDGHLENVAGAESIGGLQRARHFVARATTSGKLLLSLINDVLDLSRLQLGQLVLNAAPFNIRETLESTVALLRHTAEVKGLKLELRVDDAVPEHVLNDTVRLRQVVLNLVANAVKFTTAGRVRVHARYLRGAAAAAAAAAKGGGGCDGEGGDKGVGAGAGAGAQGGGGGAGRARVLPAPDESQPQPAGGRVPELVCVSVKDTGRGIRASDRQRIFSFGERAVGDAANAAYDPTGCGFGLAICQQLVARMGGSISVKSDVGRGSEFSFTLSTVLRGTGVRSLESALTPEQRPRSLQARLECPATPAPAPALSSKEVRAVIEGRKVLVVDDNVFNAEVLCELLRAGGVVATGVNSGEAALQAVGALGAPASGGRSGAGAPPAGGARFDCVLMDCSMPGMDGFETTRRMLAHWRGQAQVPGGGRGGQDGDGGRGEQELARASRSVEAPVVALTAYTEQRVHDDCAAAGMVDVATKPIQIEELHNIVARNLLRSAGAGAGAGGAGAADDQSD